MASETRKNIVCNRIPEKFYNPRTAVEQSELTRFENIPTSIFPTVEGGAEKVADTIERTIRIRQEAGEPCVLLLGTGNSLTPIFNALVAKHRKGLSFSNVIIFNAYEYYPLKDEGQNSAMCQLRERLLNHIDVKPQNIMSPDGHAPQDKVQAHCRLYEHRISSYERIDIALLGIGRMGNIAANEPGSGITSTTRLILIDNTVRQEMTLSFGSPDRVPPCSITVGVQTILRAERIFLAAWGDEKAEIIQKTVEGKMTETFPATFLQSHGNAQVITDMAAAGRLTRVVHPWLVADCDWNDKLTRAALVWLCGITGKPILKLTNKDYNEHGLSELLALYGSAYNANIKIFNDLQHTITGWPGGKPNTEDAYRPERSKPFPKRVLVFSPHPDDDVISMGGTLRKLVEQGHDVHVGYQTSGNIAVNDEEVMRYMHFVNGFNKLFGTDKNEVIRGKYKDIKDFLLAKKEGDTDPKDILAIKGLIRRGEARTACAFNHLLPTHVHFLDMPFYESGKIEKFPMSEADVKIVRNLMVKVKPHQIYVAGDLADPHGTHQKCTEAVLTAIEEEKKANASWISDCRIWMYRGAWAEWEIENIEMCVPMSPEELRAKRDSILKHQSQMENAPFLGNDERLFWQRAEDRNRGTATIYDKLGLACYEAMEAFVEYKP